MRALLSLLVVLALGCGSEDGRDRDEPFDPWPDHRSETYSDPEMWLCTAGAVNHCDGDLRATEVKMDGSLVEHAHPYAEDPDLDCFYVYPTVRLEAPPGNAEDLSDVSLELDPLLSQAARFSRTCRVFAPLYRQVTMAGILDTEHMQEYRAVAYSDVLDAFQHYLANFNDGRDFVLLGHSQGSMMLGQLIANEIDPEPRLRERMVSALLVGSPELAVPPGEIVGGTFENVPVCTEVGERGCVVGFTSFAAGSPVARTSPFHAILPEGLDPVCANPVTLAGGRAPFTGSYFPNSVNQPLFGAEAFAVDGARTPFTLYRHAFTGECTKAPDGTSYLEIDYADEPNDARDLPPLRDPTTEAYGLGLHVADYNFALDDLIALVEAQAASR